MFKVNSKDTRTASLAMGLKILRITLWEFKQFNKTNTKATPAGN